ncbi:hypothetical protein PTKIN_Ptkin07bG0032600 [Pterospermum kingtungense]
MEEKPSSPRVSRKGRGGGPTRKNRYAIDEGGDFVECSGKYCKSCTAGVIADCVALCCCPCALLNLLTFALVKVPWKIGRKCLGLGEKKKRKCKKNTISSISIPHNGNESDGDLGEKVRVEDEGNYMWRFSTEEGEEEMGNFSARFEADQKVWLELYQVGHLGFGRVSFSGT